MKHFARLILLTLGLGLLAALTGLVGPQPKSTNAGVAAAVNVVNTPGVNANQSGPWNVGINANGTPDVNIANMPTVNLAQGTTVGVTGGNFSVSNTPTTPVFTQDVSDPVLQPIQFDLCVQAFDLVDCNGLSSAFQVPFKALVPFQVLPRRVARMVIDTVSANCGVNNVQMLGLTTATAANGSIQVTHIFVPAPGPGPMRFVSAQTVRIYADPSTLVGLSATPIPPLAGYFCNAHISAHLITE